MWQLIDVATRHAVLEENVRLGDATKLPAVSDRDVQKFSGRSWQGWSELDHIVVWRGYWRIRRQDYFGSEAVVKPSK